VHIIDVSDPEEPEVVAFVDLPCGSHTETVVPDLRNDRLLVYSNPSSGAVSAGRPARRRPSCNGFDVVEVPLDDPSEASYIHFESEDPEEIAYADPALLVDPNPPVGIEGGGDWSTYWYHGYIYEGDMTRGLLVWRLKDRAVSGAFKLGRLNPQTQEFSIRGRGR
jgi:hypothetical protein